jgi:hypothetical protein
LNVVNFTNGTGEYIKCLKMEIDCFIRQMGIDGKARDLDHFSPK